MRAILLLAIFVPLVGGGATYLGVRVGRALNARARLAGSPRRIDEIEKENARLDEIIRRQQEAEHP